MDDRRFRDIRPTTTVERTRNATLPQMLGAWGLGTLMAAIVFVLVWGWQPPEEVDDGTVTTTTTNPAVTEQALEVNVNAVLHLPTATVTPTRTPTPMATTVSGRADECTDDTERGSVCRVPIPPTATATPYPVCRDGLIPGTFCKRGFAPEVFWE